MERVIVSMSGGVDSTAAAILLKEAGYDVVGVHMQLFDCLDPNRKFFRACCSIEDLEDARVSARRLGVPLYLIDMKKEFGELVIGNFINEYRNGRTPNPCIRCNQWMKFDLLVKKTERFGARFLATGHYARREFRDGFFRLKKGLDQAKDQSYFLFILKQNMLERTLFPLGELRKSEVRDVVKKSGLKVFDKEDSQEICFASGGDYHSLISGRAVEGDIVDIQGRKIGSHRGFFQFTIGQRKGLGVASGKPLYVLDIIPERNLVVAGGEEYLYVSALTASELSWVSGRSPTFPMRAVVKIRYRDRGEEAVVESAGSDRISVRFERPVRAVTPGQAVVIYQGDEVIGGGWIEKNSGHGRFVAS